MNDPNAVLPIVQKYALFVVGVAGLMFVLYRYATTGQLEMGTMTVFTGLLGFSSMTHGATTEP